MSVINVALAGWKEEYYFVADMASYNAYQSCHKLGILSIK